MFVSRRFSRGYSPLASEVEARTLPEKPQCLRLTLQILLSLGSACVGFAVAIVALKGGLYEEHRSDVAPFDGLGYVKYPDQSHNLSVIGVFHQLHCLYTLRRAYYSTSLSELEDFDFGIQRQPHVKHCFEYLRQSLLCAADSTLEPAKEVENGFLGWGFTRQCRDVGQLKNWAEEWRAFEAYGFLAKQHVRHKSD
ncbi:MAG: hypothetical protein Q9226_000758 [Calogaya cf. arnoldii]